jgi:AAA domain
MSENGAGAAGAPLIVGGPSSRAGGSNGTRTARLEPPAVVKSRLSHDRARTQGKARSLEFRSFSHLQSRPPEPEWLWRGYLAASSLTMLSGHAFKGKSMLVAGLLRALEDEAAFLGRATKRASAVLVSEEDEGVLRGRADAFGLLGLRSEYLSRNSGVFAVDWGELIEKATARALASGHRLLIVDTFPGLAGLRDEQENDAGAVAERRGRSRSRPAKGWRCCLCTT